MGHTEIWGATVPQRNATAGKTIKSVSENIPTTGFSLTEAVVFGLTTKDTETIGARSESVVLDNS